MKLGEEERSHAARTLWRIGTIRRTRASVQFVGAVQCQAFERCLCVCVRGGRQMPSSHQGDGGGPLGSDLRDGKGGEEEKLCCEYITKQLNRMI